MSRLGIDLDGVVYDFHETFRVLCSQKYHTDILEVESWTNWNFWELWNLPYSEEQLLADFEEFCDTNHMLWWKGAPIAGARECLEWFARETDHELVIVTHRPEYAIEATEAWLSRYAIPHDSLEVCHDGNKTVYGLDLLLDDRVANLEAAAEVDETPVCFDRPWNRPDSTPPWTGDRVSWDSFPEYVGALTTE